MIYTLLWLFIGKNLRQQVQHTMINLLNYGMLRLQLIVIFIYVIYSSES
jgi:uncharacterized protein YqhQ